MASLKRVSGFQQPSLSPRVDDSRGEEDKEEEDKEEDKDEKSSTKVLGAAAKTVFVEDASENAKQWMMAGLPPLPTTDKEVKKKLNKLMRQESFTTSTTTENKKTNFIGSGQQEVSKQTQNYYYSSDSDVPQNATNTMNKFNNKQTSALTSNLRRVDSTLLANTVMCRPEDDPDARLEESSTTADDGKTPTTMKKLTPEDFEALYLVGQGAFGKVFQVRKKDTGVLYAMKVMKKEVVIAKEQMEYTKQERDILTSITHPYVVKLRFSFQTATKLYLVLDFINGGHLFYWMYREGMFDVGLTRFYIAEIVCGIGHLHSLNIMHRDLKPENILVDREGHVRITDFGLAKKFSSDGEKANSLVGSIDYMAPEILKDKGHGKEADWWSVGVLLYEMLIGQLPFRGKNKAAIQKAITSQKIKMPTFVENDAAKLIQNLTMKDPNLRLGSDVNLKKDSTSKNGTEEVKKHKFFSKINWAKLEKREVPAPFVPKIDQDKGDGCVAHFDKKWTDAKVHAEAESAAASPSSAEQHHFLGFTYVSPTQLAYFGSKMSIDENERFEGDDDEEDDDDLRKLTAATRNMNMNNNNNNTNTNRNSKSTKKNNNDNTKNKNDGEDEELSFDSDEETALDGLNNDTTINSTFENDNRSSSKSSSLSSSRDEEEDAIRQRFQQRTPPPRPNSNNTTSDAAASSSANTSGRTTPISVNKPKEGSRSQSPWMR